MSSIILMLAGIAAVFLPFIYAANVFEELNKNIICDKVLDMAGLSDIKR